MSKKEFNPDDLTFSKPRHPSGLDRNPRTFDWTEGDKEAFRPQAQRSAGNHERALAERREQMLARWSHKNEGTPETHERASRLSQGALARLHLSGAIDDDQFAWALEIGIAAEAIERDVAVRIVDYEPRIDCGASGRDVRVEGILRVRREIAYREWRRIIPNPKRAILDMLTGEPQSFSAVARHYRTGKRKMRNLLIASIDLWPDAMAIAEKEADAASIAAAHAGLV